MAAFFTDVSVVTSIEIPGLEKHISGKVREVFDLHSQLLIVATDRISAFDVILPTGIPDKGTVLTQLSAFWFEQLREIVPSHVVEVDIDDIIDTIHVNGAPVSSELKEQLDGRSMVVKKASALPVECVARGYISGSLWKEYKQYPAHGGTVTLHGHTLPVGLRESDKLPEPIFTPATKAHTGHDENVSVQQVEEQIGTDLTRRLQEITLTLYRHASEYAIERGIIIADTKFEFGLLDGEIVWIDEALTPDSSRFWDASTYKPGQPQASFDKQFVRDYLETLDWNKESPGPELPAEILEKTAEKYRDCYARITGETLPG